MLLARVSPSAFGRSSSDCFVLSDGAVVVGQHGIVNGLDNVIMFNNKQREIFYGQHNSSLDETRNIGAALAYLQESSDSGRLDARLSSIALGMIKNLADMSTRFKQIRTDFIGDTNEPTVKRALLEAVVILAWLKDNRRYRLETSDIDMYLTVSRELFTLGPSLLFGTYRYATALSPIAIADVGYTNGVMHKDVSSGLNQFHLDRYNYTKPVLKKLFAGTELDVDDPMSRYLIPLLPWWAQAVHMAISNKYILRMKKSNTVTTQLHDPSPLTSHRPSLLLEQPGLSTRPISTLTARREFKVMEDALLNHPSNTKRTGLISYMMGGDVINSPCFLFPDFMAHPVGINGFLSMLQGVEVRSQHREESIGISFDSTIPSQGVSLRDCFDFINMDRSSPYLSGPSGSSDSNRPLPTSSTSLPLTKEVRI